MSIRVYIDGEIHQPETARVSVFDRGFLFGDSVFETIAFLDGRFVFLDEHLDRLERSASLLHLILPARSQIERALRETALASGEREARVRVMVTRGAAGIDLDPATAEAPSLVVIAQPLGAPSPSLVEEGAAVEVVKVSRGAAGGMDPMIKSGNYLTSVLAIAEARRKRPGAHEAILCSAGDSIAEGATSNVFFVAQQVLCTPGLEVGILDGVTRAKVLQLARRAGIETRELSFVAPERLRAAEEIFLTSAVRGILPVTSVDGVRIGLGRPGPVTRRLFDLYQRLVSEVA
jgi:branched-chain amino acid aminotransferase